MRIFKTGRGNGVFMERKAIKKRGIELMNALKLTSKLSIGDAVKLLGVSESTVRRLLSQLEKEGLIIRSYGGVSLAKSPENNYVYEKLETRYVEEKSRIGRYAASLVCDGDSVFLDSGTTLPHMCIELAARFEKGELSGLKIFTSSLINLNLLSKYTPVVLIGGEYRPNRRDFCGYVAEETIKKLHFNKAFLGTDGYDTKFGFTTTDFATAHLNSVTIEHSDKVFILTESSKLSHISVVSYALPADADAVITDSMPPETAKQFTRTDTEIILV